MNCENCGISLPDDARFCSECGAKVGEAGGSSSSNITIQGSIISGGSISDEGIVRDTISDREGSKSIKELIEMKSDWDKVLHEKRKKKQELEHTDRRLRHDMDLEKFRAESEARERWHRLLKESDGGSVGVGSIKASTMLKAKLLRDFERSIEAGDLNDAHAKGVQVVEHFKNEVKIDVLSDLEKILGFMKEHIRTDEVPPKSITHNTLNICQVLWESMPIEQLEGS